MFLYRYSRSRIHFTNEPNLNILGIKIISNYYLSLNNSKGVIEFSANPRFISDDEINTSCKNGIAESGAQNITDMGKVMKILKEKYFGVMDFAKAGKILKEQLQGWWSIPNLILMKLIKD